MHHKIINKVRPKGHWRAYDGEGYGLQVKVAGTKYQFSKALEFVYGARLADKSGLAHALEIVREPKNKHDANALAVVGHWMQPGFWILIKPKAKKVLLGYVPRELALKIAQFPKDMPLAGELNYFKANSSGIDIYFSLLIPGLKSGYWKDRDNPF